MEIFMSPKFSNLLTEFMKKPQYTIFITVYVESWRNTLDQKKNKKQKKIGATFMDLSKAFVTTDHKSPDSKAKGIWFFCRLAKIHFKLSKEQKTKNGYREFI